MAKECQLKQKKAIKSNVATFSYKEKSEDGWDIEVSLAVEEEELALSITIVDQIDYKNDWIIHSGCLNHRTMSKQKLKNFSEYKANNSRLSIVDIGKIVITPQYSPKQVII